MRDIKRIDRILLLIETYWKENPDLRFGQMLINLGIIPDTLPSWNMEDGNWEKWIMEHNDKRRKS
jgi:hypothetical protein